MYTGLLAQTLLILQWQLSYFYSMFFAYFSPIYILSFHSKCTTLPAARIDLDFTFLWIINAFFKKKNLDFLITPIFSSFKVLEVNQWDEILKNSRPTAFSPPAMHLKIYGKTALISFGQEVLHALTDSFNPNHSLPCTLNRLFKASGDQRPWHF